MNTNLPSLVEPYPGQFRITWRNGGYFVSAPNYNGGEVVPVETVRSLEAFQSNELLRLRAELETERRKVEALERGFDAEQDFSDNLWLAEIARHWSDLTGKPWDTRDGETREEGIAHNISALFTALTPTERTKEEK